MYGFEVDIATNSVNMLRSLQKSLPDCIILDYEMPDINGPQLCKTLKTHSDYNSIPIIILTGHEGKEYILEAIQSGADDFASKSLDHEVLVTKINAVIRFHDTLLRNVELERFRAIHTLITILNHAINNPLAIALGILGKGPASIDQKKYDAIKQYLNRISDVIKDMKKISVDSIGFKHYSKRKELLDINKNAG